jgi:hypothetical protein
VKPGSPRQEMEMTDNQIRQQIEHFRDIDPMMVDEVVDFLDDLDAGRLAHDRRISDSIDCVADLDSVLHRALVARWNATAPVYVASASMAQPSSR